MAGITLLDGGLGQEIHRRSNAPAHPLWSVKVMMDAPEIVVGAHRDFIEAGADVICINSYAATPSRLERDGDADEFDAAQRRALELAHQAVREAGASAQVAGCLPPLVASYRTEVSKPYEASRDEYRRIVASQREGVDLFIIETMSILAEALAAIDAAKEQAKPIYLSLTISDDGESTLRSGEPLAEALDAVAARGVDGILLNCSLPEAITKAMPLLARTGVRFGAYANGFTSVEALAPGTTVDRLEARSDLGPDAYADHAFHWLDQGATILGGCCEVSPAHIRKLHERLQDAGVPRTGL